MHRRRTKDGQRTDKVVKELRRSSGEVWTVVWTGPDRILGGSRHGPGRDMGKVVRFPEIHLLAYKAGLSHRLRCKQLTVYDTIPFL